jgi:hypothetical protein
MNPSVARASTSAIAIDCPLNLSFVRRVVDYRCYPN